MGEIQMVEIVQRVAIATVMAAAWDATRVPRNEQNDTDWSTFMRAVVLHSASSKNNFLRYALLMAF